MNGSLPMISALRTWATQPATPRMNGPFLLEPGEPAEIGIELLLGLLTDGAGVDDDDVRALRTGGFRRAGPAENSGDVLGIVLVHLTAEGPDEDLQAG